MSITETIAETSAAPTPNLDPSTNSTLPLTGSEPKLYAGKYKSIEDLEAAYKEGEKFIGENANLKRELEKYTKPPEDYEVSNDIALRDIEIQELKAIAKNAGLNQEQFLKTAKEMQSRINYQLTSFEQAKQELGEANLNILTDYVSKNYPERLREVVLTKLIKDKDAMTDAMKHRETVLNNQAPGMDKASAEKPQKYDGEKDLKEAAQAYHKNPKDHKARDRYIELARATGEERFKRG